MHQSKRVPRMNVDKGPVVDRGRKLHKVEIVTFCCLGMVKPDEANDSRYYLYGNLIGWDKYIEKKLANTYFALD